VDQKLATTITTISVELADSCTVRPVSMNVLPYLAENSNSTLLVLDRP
jgi:hypothetical protein